MQKLDLQLPSSKEQILQIQSERKKIALERARKAGFYHGKLDRINSDHLDEPEEWAKVPIIDKETLREIGPEKFTDQFFIGKAAHVAEYWRSGGATGVPLFYPRTYEDMSYSYLQLCRCWSLSGVKDGDLCHMSFPLGVHPAGQLWARTANQSGVGVIWAGAGAGTPSQTQIELIQTLKPSIWMGMPSYGLHLANLADNQGIDLADCSVQKVLVGAEALSSAKREKLERSWGAEVNDLFGMTEIGILGADSPLHEGFHVWTDQAVFEVVDENTGLPVPDGEEGLMVITPLFINNATPFLRWSSGDIVRIRDQSKLEGPFSVFPIMQHSHRTVGFFKVRGININHSEFEDFMFSVSQVNDFRGEVLNEGDNDIFRVLVEIRRGSDPGSTTKGLLEMIHSKFELRPEIVLLENGTLAKEFEKSIKAPRFQDKRS
tara:strand:+ start:220 stop:1515 length:1296 start_codon:yes stop_codon:yes gene_type:complete